mmetsp:Transcript_29064/g.49672  ORF Transcript_29064/g.49672 Transcript_29064/m.49672 type:complete len:315 (+) Transcript_29064:253-1197(+)
MQVGHMGKRVYKETRRVLYVCIRKPAGSATCGHVRDVRGLTSHSRHLSQRSMAWRWDLDILSSFVHGIQDPGIATSSGDRPPVPHGHTLILPAMLAAQLPHSHHLGDVRDGGRLCYSRLVGPPIGRDSPSNASICGRRRRRRRPDSVQGGHRQAPHGGVLGKQFIAPLVQHVELLVCETCEVVVRIILRQRHERKCSAAAAPGEPTVGSLGSVKVPPCCDIQHPAAQRQVEGPAVITAVVQLQFFTGKSPLRFRRRLRHVGLVLWPGFRTKKEASEHRWLGWRSLRVVGRPVLPELGGCSSRAEWSRCGSHGPD